MPPRTKPVMPVMLARLALAFAGLAAPACLAQVQSLTPTGGAPVPHVTAVVVVADGTGLIGADTSDPANWPALTYTGFLTLGGEPWQGSADLRFTFHRTPVAEGTPAGADAPVGPPLELSGAAVAGGRFACDLPVSPDALTRARFIEVSVRRAGDGAFTVIRPRTPISAGTLAAISAAGPGTGGAAGSDSPVGREARGGDDIVIGALAGQGAGANVESASPGVPNGFARLSAPADPHVIDSGQDWQCVGTTLFYLGGSVGIGTDSPDARLSVFNATGNAITGTATGANARGVFGQATHTTGGNTGVYGFTASNNGRGVFGGASASTGPTAGVYGNSNSNTGSGVFGNAAATSGTTFGVQGVAASPNGRGVFGQTTHPTGLATGVYGFSSSSSGRGVFGGTSAPTGPAVGVYGNSNSTAGTGVYGNSAAGSGVTTGVRGVSASTGGRGVYGSATASSGTNYGGYFDVASPAGTALYAFKSATGDGSAVHARSDATGGQSLWGEAAATTGDCIGVFGSSGGSTGTGVLGAANATTGIVHGVRGTTQSTAGRGVFGRATASSGDTFCLSGQDASTAGTAVFGISTATTGPAVGGYFQTASTTGNGVYGFAEAGSGVNYGVAGATNSTTNGFGVFAFGRSGASGTKSFRIDHPQDPANKYLLHYSSESPEVLNTYSGTITLDASGGETVVLPEYFGFINKDPRYSLTAIGAPMPMLHVAEEFGAGDEAGAIGRTFVVAGGAPGGKVSWRVEAVRNDAWVRAYGAPVEVEKTGADRGAYQNPELIGAGSDVPPVGVRERIERRAGSFER